MIVNLFFWLLPATHSTLPNLKTIRSHSRLLWVGFFCSICLGSAWTVSADGLWKENGVNVCNARNDQYSTSNVGLPDHSLVIIWDDNRDNHSNIFIQRLDAAGNTLWGNNGMPICPVNYKNQYTAQAVRSETENVLVVWIDDRNGSNDIYMQKIDGTGHPVTPWPSEGVLVCGNAAAQDKPVVASDQNGGAWVFWQDKRSGDYYDIYGQHIDADGLTSFAAGIPICVAPNHQAMPQTVSDGSGGAVVVWEDRRFGNLVQNWSEDPQDGSRDKVFAQHLDASGNKLWLEDGIPVGDTTSANALFVPALTATTNGNVMVIWMNRLFRSSDQWQQDYFAVQSITREGTLVFGAAGKPLCTPTVWYPKPTDPARDLNLLYPKIISDNATGAVAVWTRKETDLTNNVYAQAISASGAFRWEVGGLGICNASFNQNLPTAALNLPNANSVTIVWEDWRESMCNLFAQRVSLTGAILWRANGVPIAHSTDRRHFAPHITPDYANGAFLDWRAGLGELLDYDISAQRIERADPFIYSVDPGAGKTGTPELCLHVQGDDFTDNQGQVVSARLTSPDQTFLISQRLNCLNRNNLDVWFNLQTAKSGNWTLTLVDSFGQTSTSSDVLFTVFDYNSRPIVATAHPNPFLPDRRQTTTLFSYPESSEPFQIKIFNLRGQMVRTLDSMNQWDGRNTSGSICEGGVYFYQIFLQNLKMSGQVILIR